VECYERYDPLREEGVGSILAKVKEQDEGGRHFFEGFPLFFMYHISKEDDNLYFPSLSKKNQ